MGHLQDWETDSYIIGSSKVLSLTVFKVFFPDCSEQLSIKGSEMTGDKGIPSIGITVKYFFRDGSGVAYQSFSKNVD